MYFTNIIHFKSILSIFSILIVDSKSSQPKFHWGFQSIRFLLICMLNAPINNTSSTWLPLSHWLFLFFYTFFIVHVEVYDKYIVFFLIQIQF